MEEDRTERKTFTDDFKTTKICRFDGDIHQLKSCYRSETEIAIYRLFRKEELAHEIVRTAAICTHEQERKELPVDCTILYLAIKTY
jgi:hypothetical protein